MAAACAILIVLLLCACTLVGVTVGILKGVVLATMTIGIIYLVASRFHQVLISFFPCRTEFLPNLEDRMRIRRLHLTRNEPSDNQKKCHQFISTSFFSYGFKHLYDFFDFSLVQCLSDGHYVHRLEK